MLLTAIHLIVDIALGATLPGIAGIERAATLEALSGKRVGALAHQASRTRAGEHLVDLLAARRDLSLVALFSPEHGIRGTEDENVPDTTDPVTGLPVYSLYGPRMAPTPRQLAAIDVLAVDLQDVGVRFYTYAATVAFTLRACKQAGVKVVLFDRPSPLGGEIVEGAVLEKDLVTDARRTRVHTISTRHGMTLGELVSLLNAEMGIHADLTVVPMAGWRRSMSWEETGLPWIAPSPALETPEQAFLYGIFGALETLDLAVGRGKSNHDAFRVYGAPWISEAASENLVLRLSALRLPGLRFTREAFTPTRAKFKSSRCNGFRVHVTDRRSVEGFRSQVEVLKALHVEFGERLGLGGATGSLGARWLIDAIARGALFAEIERKVEEDARPFLASRRTFLRYP
jgi:uncharacterized protein YbbC (DUF1343 family)